MSVFEEFLTELKGNLLTVVKEGFETYKEQVLADGSAFAVKTKDDLQKWLKQLKEGILTKDDFELIIHFFPKKISKLIDFIEKIMT